MQLLAQGFEVLVIGGMEDAQGIVIAANDDAVEVLHVDMGLSVKMCACVAAFGNEDFDYAGVGDGNRAVGHGLRTDRHKREGVQTGLHDGAAGGKCISGRTCRRGNNQAVRTLGIDKFLIDKYFKFNHLACTATRQYGVVEG